MQKEFDIIITTNSPGELYALVRPLVKEIAYSMPQARIILAITPCQFSSGLETKVAKHFDEISFIITPEELKRWTYYNSAPDGIKFSKKGVVVFMGGDLFYAHMIARKLRLHAIAYTYGRIAWKNTFSKFLFPDSKSAESALKSGLKMKKMGIVGDLMVDGVESKMTRRDVGFDENKETLVFMPGSRPKHTSFLAPFFVKAAELLLKIKPNIQIAFALSPYTRHHMIEDTIVKELDNSYFVFEKDNRKYLSTKSGKPILLLDHSPHDAMNVADIVITIPGTNTAEIAALGKPMLAVVPFNKPEVYLFEGTLGILGTMPFIGTIIKIIAIYILNKSVKLIALPNIKAGKMLVPELRGVLKPEMVSNKIIEMLENKDKLEKMGSELKHVMGPKGASKKIVEEIRHLLT